MTSKPLKVIADRIKEATSKVEKFSLQKLNLNHKHFCIRLNSIFSKYYIFPKKNPPLSKKRLKSLSTSSDFLNALHEIDQCSDKQEWHLFHLKKLQFEGGFYSKTVFEWDTRALFLQRFFSQSSTSFFPLRERYRIDLLEPSRKEKELPPR